MEWIHGISILQQICKMEGKWNGKFYKIIEIEMWNGIGVENEWNRKGRKKSNLLDSILGGME